MRQDTVNFCLTLSMAILYAFGFAASALAIDSSLQKSDVYISSEHLMQSDTLLVIVKNEPNDIAGKLGKLKLHFIRSEDNKDWVAIAGIPINKKPGKYELVVNVYGKAPFRKNIAVLKKNFSETRLALTPELVKKGYSFPKIIKNVNKENKDLKSVLDVFNSNAYFSKPFLYPLSEIKVSGLFGEIRKIKNYKIQHLGVDLKAPVGTPVYAVNDGKVVFEKELPDYGKILILDHGIGVYSIYLHLSDFKVAIGQMLKQGDIVALAGNTGYALGPHLHFSVKVRGAVLDPLKFIETTQVKW